ncbi:hypothetical protein P9112_005669 [Eukaryota sp. TZLM1-RC]
MGLTRGDLVVPGLNGSFTILDAMSIDPCNSSNEHFVNSDVSNPLLAGETYKIAKYANLFFLSMKILMPNIVYIPLLFHCSDP